LGGGGKEQRVSVPTTEGGFRGVSPLDAKGLAGFNLKSKTEVRERVKVIVREATTKVDSGSSIDRVKQGLSIEVGWYGNAVSRCVVGDEVTDKVESRVH